MSDDASLVTNWCFEHGESDEHKGGRSGSEDKQHDMNNLLSILKLFPRRVYMIFKRQMYILIFSFSCTTVNRIGYTYIANSSVPRLFLNFSIAFSFAVPHTLSNLSDGAGVGMRAI